jgi:lysophospholipase L1-like esterase
VVRVRLLASLLAVAAVLASCAESPPTTPGATPSSTDAASRSTPSPWIEASPSASNAEAAAPSAGPGGVYLALGDSLTFGIGVPQPAQQGFVARVAAALADAAEPITEVRAFAVPGETAGGFLDRRLDDVVTAIEGYGPRVELVTVGLGANEVLRTRREPACAADRGSDPCRAVVSRAIEEADAALDAIVAALRSTLAANGSDARILLLAYYSPETDPPAVEAIAGADGAVGCDPGDGRPGLNDAIACIAAARGATLVDLYAAFLGRERELTHIGARDVHPNANGYEVIADSIVAAVGDAVAR